MSGWFKMGDFPSTRPVRRRCWRKERHLTRGKAEAQARSLERRGLDGEGVHVYACPDCVAADGSKGWHVGHYPGMDKTWRRA